MAWMWFEWRSFCVIFILFTLHVDVFGSNDVYLYHTDINPRKSNFELEFLDDESLHQIIKRDAPPITSNIEQHIADNRSNQQLPVNITKDAKTPLLNKAPLLEAKNSTFKKVQLLGKNLGENGHGIRKNYTTTTLSPVLNVTTNATNSISNASVETTTQNHDEEDLAQVDDDIGINKFSGKDDSVALNETLKTHNITITETDSHIYYNSTFVIDPTTAKQYWVDLNPNDTDVIVNALLSRSHRRAVTIKLSFDFPFYGHLIRNITLATGGFIYTGEHVHSWLAATQYIAPLMANFDTSLSNNSFIKYKDNGTAFTVQWENVSLQDKPSDGEFTFQATLFNNGDIVFVYKSIPIVVEEILDVNHPVKVGLSDAYIIDRTIFFLRRKTIYEYHRVNFNKNDIKNWTTIHLQAQQTCLDNKDCSSCLTKDINNFECSWCPSLNRCSTGLDRNRQDWLTKGCDRKQVLNDSQCSQLDNIDFAIHHDGQDYYYGPNRNYDHDPNNTYNDSSSTPSSFNNGGGRTRHIEGSVVSDGAKEDSMSDVQASRILHGSSLDVNGKMSASGILTILFLGATVTALAFWVLYAYRNPHTTSGQILIKHCRKSPSDYRPSQWRWRRGEARYTAATIHM